MGDLIDAAVNRRLMADATMASFFGPRIFPNGAPKNTARPYLVWRLVNSQQERTLAGPLNNGSAQFAFQAVADDYNTARKAGEAVRVVFDGWRDGAEDPRIASALASGPQMLVDFDTDPWMHIAIVSAAIRFILNP